VNLLKWLRLPDTRNIDDLDAPASTLLHGRIIERKGFLKKLYTDFYNELIRLSDANKDKVIVEIGSGGGFLKQIIPNVITSDVLELPGVDKVFNACRMPFEDVSIDAIVMIDVLHHISEPVCFFDEATRCLKDGGKVVMIEPANTAWSGFIYRNFHHEAFDTEAGWSVEKTGPLSGGNGALPWIIFRRDRDRFNRQYSQLTVENIRLHTPFAYLLSGGFTLRQLAPSFCYRPVRALEYILSPLNRWIAMFQTIELKKVSASGTASVR